MYGVYFDIERADPASVILRTFQGFYEHVSFTITSYQVDGSW